MAFGRNSQCTYVKHLGDNAGRYIIVQFTIGHESFILVNIYAPNKDNPDFFLEIFKKLEDVDGKRILVGDFNLVLDIEKDVKTEKGDYINKKNSREILSEYMNETLLTDIWRDLNPEKVVYTWRKIRKAKYGSRID